MHIENSTFLRNTANAKGGAVYTNYVQFGQNVFFINNTAKDHGGAVYTDYISNNLEEKEQPCKNEALSIGDIYKIKDLI